MSRDLEYTHVGNVTSTIKLETGHQRNRILQIAVLIFSGGNQSIELLFQSTLPLFSLMSTWRPPVCFPLDLLPFRTSRITSVSRPGELRRTEAV